jgi:hypothetical protein
MDRKREKKLMEGHTDWRLNRGMERQTEKSY